MGKIKLRKISTETIRPIPPFNFEATYKPSHFETPLERYEKGKYWFTIRFMNKIFGIKMWSEGSLNKPKVKISIYSRSKIDELTKKALIEEISFRLGFNEDIREFISIASKDPVMKEPLKKLKGMRVTALESLYELLIIAIMLQNANVSRTRSMMRNLLEKFGKKVEFDGKELYAFFTPKDIVKAKRKDLDVCKLGYRDKFVLAISKSFLNGEVDEMKLRRVTKEEAKRELMKLMGIGEYSAGIFLFEALKHYDELVLDIWNTPILAKQLFGKESQDRKKVLQEMEKRFGKWKGLAGLYILENLYWNKVSK
jgi:3-methyladenine DNA glycosylase/8-oxoguanine DNA glycosylase